MRTLEGSMTARKGDYIVKGVKGELYPVKPDIFEATYGSVDAQKDWRAAVTEANDLLNDVIGLEAAGDMEVPEYPFARILCAADELGSVEGGCMDALCEMARCVAVWNDCALGRCNARQRLALRRLKEAGLYRGGMPRERSEG